MTIDEARGHIGGGVVYLPNGEDGVITAVPGRARRQTRPCWSCWRDNGV